MRIGYKLLTILTSIIAFLSILQVASRGLADNFLGGEGGP